MAQFELKQITSEKDLVYCVEAYAKANDESFLPVHFETALNYVRMHLRLGSFLRILVKDSERVGCVLAIKGNAAAHSNLKAMIQNYYWCTLSGFSAARMVVFVHKQIEEEARKHRLPLLVSTGSHMDETNSFIRILANQGWDTRGYIAIKKLKYP
jgi:hypothetical protein